MEGHEKRIMSTRTPELRNLIDQAEAEPVEFTDPETNTRFVVVRADVFQKMRALLAEEERDREEHESWEKLARKARARWAEENVY
jgi:hypothetical protein